MVATVVVLLLAVDPQGSSAIPHRPSCGAAEDRCENPIAIRSRSPDATRHKAPAADCAARAPSQRVVHLTASQRFYAQRSFNYRLQADYPWHATAAWGQRRWVYASGGQGCQPPIGPLPGQDGVSAEAIPRLGEKSSPPTSNRR